MPCTINASITSTGLIHSADATGVLNLQTNGSNALTVNANANVTVNNSLFVSGNSVQPLVSDTAKNSTSGTTVDFTGIPSWVKRITVMFNGVSSNGTSNYLVQLGTSSGFVSTGYEASSAYILSNTQYLNTQYTTGFGIAQSTASNIISGFLQFCNVSGNIWVMSGNLTTTQNATFMNAGRISLAAVLTQLRLTTVNGTDTFDAGSVNILYE
jgi:hypothetical protein